MKVSYRIGGRTEQLKGLNIGNTFCYPDSDTVFLLTDDNLESKPQIVDIESGIRYVYNPELSVIKVECSVEVKPAK